MDTVKFRSEVAHWFAYTIMTGIPHKLIHDYDPPWDYSGILVSDQDSKFNLQNYKILSDFLEEYTGNTTATYCSGCGLSADTYEEVLYNLAGEHAIEIMRIEKNVPEDYDDWTNEQQDEEINTQYALMDLAKTWDCQELFDEGKADAINQLLQEEAEHKARRLEHKLRFQAGKELCTKYLEPLSKEQICKDSDEWKRIKPILLTLTEDQLKCIGACLANVSNSISCELNSGIIHCKKKKK